MSLLPLKPCRIPGCPRLTRTVRCDIHERISERARGSSPERGYDPAHRKLRPVCFERDNWRCVDCGWQPDIVLLYSRMHMGPVPVDRVFDELRRRANRGERHLHMDHIEPIADRPDLRLDLANVATRCNVCHNKKTRTEQNSNPFWDWGRAGNISNARP